MRAKLSAVIAYVTAFMATVRAGFTNRFSTLWDIQSRKLGNRAQGGTVEQVIVVGATLLIGIVVMAQIVESMPAVNNTFNGSIDQVTGILDSSFLLAAILPLVIVAGAVLFFVGQFGTRNR
jgi:hypothetical protein